MFGRKKKKGGKIVIDVPEGTEIEFVKHEERSGCGGCSLMLLFASLGGVPFLM